MCHPAFTPIAGAILRIARALPGTVWQVACLEENTLFEFLCGGLTAGARDAVAEHATVCAGCRRMIAAAAAVEPVAVAQLAQLAPPAPRQPAERSPRVAVERADPGVRPDHLLAGKYRLLRLLGAGGMGTVHEAVNTWTGRHVAVKQLRRAWSSDAVAAQRFMHEARSASRIAHPSVVDILDLGQDPGTGALFMVQELLAGATLRERLAERGALPVAEVVEIVAPALAALSVAHAAGVVHRDVKPGNLFLARGPRGGEITKLIDFGLSKQLRGGPELAITGRGRRLGTPFYMAPEQLRGEAEIDERVDVWSIGVVLFEAVAGVRPFRGPSCHDLVGQVLNQPVPRLADVAPAVPAALGALVARALERDRERRPSASELGDALAALVRKTSLRARRPAPCGCRRPARW